MSYRKACILTACIFGIILTLPILINDWNESPTVSDWLMLLLLEVIIQEIFILFKKTNNKL